ncbi:hypothetical protein DFJ74DRAFT_654653 [Hyaloraphidium curvatum]|nr:hypothetical protein DFJ74DRAFT_654653 [Hyaloraphidium curvatum]
MSRPVYTALLSLLAAVILLVAGAAAAPGGKAPVVFKRSCGECDSAAFCEFAYPNAPEGHVACVGHADSQHLYRRYEASKQATLTMVALNNGGQFSTSAQAKSLATTLTIFNPGDGDMTVTAISIGPQSGTASWDIAAPTPTGVITAGGDALLTAYATYVTDSQGTLTPVATFTVLATNAAGDLPVTPTAFSFTATATLTYVT